MSKPRVLISDKMSPLAVETLEKRGCEVVVKTGMTPEELGKVIGDFDGLAIRSSTRATAEIIEQAKKLKVIGRAGIGVDNVDRSAATQAGIVVMNTPYGNAITTAEHAIAMMFSLARQIPQASSSTHQGKWEKSKFMGVELTNKRLGMIGCGNIGSLVAERALGLKMKVSVFDPFLSEARAQDLGVQRVDLETLLQSADVITLHTPLTEGTKNILSAEALAKTKKGVSIINCARGGLVDEEALAILLKNGHVGGAAFDVFAVEPAKENPLFGLSNVIVTPHLGAATSEAQEKVAEQIAEQIADYLLDGAVSNGLNMPSVTAEEAPKLSPYITLAQQLGSFTGQLTGGAAKVLTIEYRGDVSTLKTAPMTQALIAAFLKPQLQNVNIVSAPTLAKERGIDVREVKTAQSGPYPTAIHLTVETESHTRSVGGTLMVDGTPRITEIKGVQIEAQISPFILYVTNKDLPGLIGDLGTLLAKEGINIATFHLGRKEAGGEAIALVSVDQPVSVPVLEQINQLTTVDRAEFLQF